MQNRTPFAISRETILIHPHFLGVRYHCEALCSYRRARSFVATLNLEIIWTAGLGHRDVRFSCFPKTTADNRPPRVSGLVWPSRCLCTINELSCYRWSCLSWQSPLILLTLTHPPQRRALYIFRDLLFAEISPSVHGQRRHRPRRQPLPGDHRTVPRGRDFNKGSIAIFSVSLVFSFQSEMFLSDQS